MDDRGSQMENPPAADGREELLDVVQITPEHIRANGTVHTSPFAGIAELVDNAVDSKAKHVKIDYHLRRPDKFNYITVIDDGEGMTKHEMCNVIRIGKSNKKCDTGTIGQFGNGLKSGSMRLGETLLVLTKQMNTFYHMLLISLRYLEDVGTQKCYVPMLSYEHTEDIEGFPIVPMIEQGEEEKHNKSLKVFLDYSPYDTEEKLIEFMSTSIAGVHGTCILVSDLKRFDNNAFELVQSRDLMVDLLINERTTAAEQKRKKNMKDEQQKRAEDNDKQTTHLSHYLSELYLIPKVAIFINGNKVNQRDPIRSLADPCSTTLPRSGLDCFAKREKAAIEKEKAKLANAQFNYKERINEVVRALRNLGPDDGPDEHRRLKKEKRTLEEESNDCQKAMAALDNQTIRDKAKEGGFDDVLMYFGIDLMRRCDARVVFYTNGRRIMSVPLVKKGYKFSRLMGVVCIIDIPSTLLPTAQNRENYEKPSEVALLMSKITTSALTFFEHADQKYKSDEFWMKLGYFENALPHDHISLAKVKECLEITGLRKFCLNCLQFWEVHIDKFLDPKNNELLTSFDLRPFRCNIEELKNRPDDEILIIEPGKCDPKTPLELKNEEIDELEFDTPRTYYSPMEAIPCDKKSARATQNAATNNSRPGPSRRSPSRPSRKDIHNIRSPTEGSESPPPRAKKTRVARRNKSTSSEKSASPSSSPSPPAKKRKGTFVPSPPPSSSTNKNAKKNQVMSAKEKARLQMDEERRRVIAMSQTSNNGPKSGLIATGRFVKKTGENIFTHPDYSRPPSRSSSDEELFDTRAANTRASQLRGVPKEEEEPSWQPRSAMQPVRGGRAARSGGRPRYQETWDSDSDDRGDERPPTEDDEEVVDVEGMQWQQRDGYEVMEEHRAYLESFNHDTVGIINKAVELLDAQKREITESHQAEMQSLRQSFEENLRRLGRMIPKSKQAEGYDQILNGIRQLRTAPNPIDALEELTENI